MQLKLAQHCKPTMVKLKKKKETIKKKNKKGSTCSQDLPEARNKEQGINTLVELLRLE